MCRRGIVLMCLIAVSPLAVCGAPSFYGLLGAVRGGDGIVCSSVVEVYAAEPAWLSPGEYVGLILGGIRRQERPDQVAAITEEILTLLTEGPDVV